MVRLAAPVRQAPAVRSWDVDSAPVLVAGRDAEVQAAGRDAEEQVGDGGEDEQARGFLVMPWWPWSYLIR